MCVRSGAPSGLSFFHNVRIVYEEISPFVALMGAGRKGRRVNRVAVVSQISFTAPRKSFLRY